MRKARIILAVIIPLLFVTSGYYYFITHLITHPLQTHVKKELVAMPEVYAGDIYVFQTTDGWVTCHNDTPLSGYWMREYLKNHTWSISVDNISLTLRPQYPEFGGVGGVGGFGVMALKIILNSTRYIERVKYISNGTEMAIKNGGDISVSLVEGEGYKREYTRYLYLPGDPNVAEIESWHIGMSNVSFECMDYVHIDERKTKEPLPYNFTAYIETKDKIYRFEFRFNITANYYPFIELWHTYVPNATYYCYIPLENKVVISDHIVEGTKYFFVEKDGKLSRIVEVRK